MNEVVKVSIAGIGFVFDTDAYEKLKAYLDRLEKGYGDDPDGREIINDIEARIVELILSKQPVEQVVSAELAGEIISQMGVPDDMVNEKGRKEAGEGDASSVFPKRLYRNPDGAKLGGVCNGLATFMNVDPVWIRLAIFIPLFLFMILTPLGFDYLNGFLRSMFGMLVLLYFVLWMVVPLARTPRQRLEMEGERITADSIKRNISQEEAAMPQAKRSASILAELFNVIGRLIVFAVKLVAIVVGFAFAVAAIALFVAIVAGLTSPVHDLPFRLGDSLSQMDGISGRAFAAMVVGTVLIPLVILVYQLVRLVFNLRNNATLMWVLGGAWLFLVAYTGIIAVRNIDKFKGNVSIVVGDDSDMVKLKRIHKWVKRDQQGTLVFRGDTLVRNGSVEAVEEAIDGLERADTAGSLKYEYIEHGGSFEISLE